MLNILKAKNNTGINNSNYKDGRTTTTECLICKKILINYKAKTGLCRRCWLQSRKGYKHTPDTIIKMKLWWKINRKYITLCCPFCKKYFKVISWKTFRKYCSNTCVHNSRKGQTRPTHSKLMKYKNNPNWQGGISKLPYSFNFNNKLKQFIRKRDKYNCRLCHLSQQKEIKKLKKKLAIHHIDYNKNNIKYINLIALCSQCHSKTNGNRDYWYAYFNYLLKHV